MRPYRSLTLAKFILTIYLSSGMFALIGLRTAVVNLEYDLQKLGSKQYDLLRKRSLIVNDLRNYFTIADLKNKLAKIPGLDINNLLNVSNIKVKPDADKKAISQRSILLSMPSNMIVGEKKRIEIPMSMNLIDSLRNQPKDNSTYKENSNGNTLLKVRLFGDNFKINSLTEERQIVMPNETTYWLWDVSPLSSGTQEITLTISEQIITNDNGEINRNILVLDKKINAIFSLSYSLSKIIKEYNAIIFSTSFIGYQLFTWFTDLLKRRREKKNNEQAKSE